MTNIPPPNSKYADRVSVTLDEPNGEAKPEKHKDVKSGLVIDCASEIEIKPISWLWPDRIARGKQTIIAGEPGLGKSQLSAYLAATVSTGGDWAGGEGSATLGKVIILSAEDDPADTMVPRLMAAGADLKNIHIVTAVMVHDGKGRVPSIFKSIWLS